MAENPSIRLVPGSAIPYVDFGGTGLPLHFLHANGYPPACYSALIQRLTTKQHVFGMLLRPLWPESDPHAIKDWKPFSDDLRRFLNEHSAANVIGVGHSIGAVVTLRLALRDPRLFQALVLIDPVLFPRRRMLQLYIVRALGLAHRLIPWIEGARRRRRRFDDLEQLFTGYRRRDVFRFFSDEQLRMLIRSLTQPASDSTYELVFSPDWEARIYETGIWNDWDIWAGLKRLTVPTLIIRGAETDTFRESTARLVQQADPEIKVVTLLACTHLLPLERPDEVFEITEQFLEHPDKVPEI